jgi:integrase
VSAERADTLKATVRDFIAVAGDKPIINYGKVDANAFKSVLLALPGNWSKRKGLREHGIVEASRRAAELSLPRQAPDTLKKKWSALGCVFAYAEANHDGVKNCFAPRSLAVSDGQPANEKGSPFTAHELKVLLGSLHPRLPSHLYWLTLLGLYTGARLNEICQLRKSLIRQHDGMHYIYFSPDLRLKTGNKDSCVRAVPIHARLIELGFLDYVSSCSDALFPGLPQHKSGRFSDGPSKAFARCLRAIGIKRPRLSFHSLRHSFVAALKRGAPRDAETRERLVGHALPGLAGRYGDSYRAEAWAYSPIARRF